MGRTLKILGIADLHGRSEQLRLLDEGGVDLVCVCGDLHNLGSREEILPAVEALASLGHRVVIVPGNMDPRMLVPKLWEDAGFMMLHHRAWTFGDFGMIGVGGIVPMSRRYDDSTRYYHRDEDVYKVLAELHRDIADKRRRIVLTHQPPRGVLDTIHSGEITGCISLRRFVEEHQPDLLICGHIHEARGETHLGATKVVNVGELRRGFCAVIEINSDIRVRWIVP